MSWRNEIVKGLERKNLSARALARAAGLSTSTVHDMLNKPGFSPQISSLEAVFEQLDIRMCYESGPDVHSAAQSFLDEKGWTDQITARDFLAIAAFLSETGVENGLKVLQMITGVEKLRTFITSMDRGVR